MSETNIITTQYTLLAVRVCNIQLYVGDALL